MWLESEKADWQSLHVVLDRCYEGSPVGRQGTFTGTVLTLCQLLEGRVIMEKDGIRIETCSREKPWIICMPGERYQEFTNDSRIISIHLAIGNPGNGAQWRGSPIVAFPPDRGAQNSINRLRTSRALKQVSRDQSLSMFGVTFPLPDAIELQENVLRFFRHLLHQLHQHGMYFEVPPIHDERVRHSHNCLASLDIRKEFSREQLAQTEGLTPGQLDRLWRAELGLTPRQYRNKNRVAYACEQLRRHDPSIKSVASDLGFRHLSQFSNWFSRHQGESPRSFRKRPQSA